MPLFLRSMAATQLDYFYDYGPKWLLVARYLRKGLVILSIEVAGEGRERTGSNLHK